MWFGLVLCLGIRALYTALNGTYKDNEKDLQLLHKTIGIGSIIYGIIGLITQLTLGLVYKFAFTYYIGGIIVAAAFVIGAVVCSFCC